MKNIILLLFLSFQTLSLVFANGGVVDENHFKKTGNIRLLQQADISLLKEDLRIKIINDTTFIEVTYFLQNNGNTQSVHYGFPVDMYKSAWRANNYVSLLDFDIWVNDIPAKYSYWRVNDAYESSQYNEEDNQKYVSKIDRQWYALKLDFEKETTQTLTIKYTIQNYHSDDYYGFGFIPTSSERKFVYDLFPSSSWSDGIVNDFFVQIDLSDLKKHECKYKIEGLENVKSQNKDGIYTFKSQNFDLKKRSYLAVIYDNEKRAIADCLQKKYQPFPILSISSSAKNTEYLIDNDPNTVWKAKEGDWIEIKLPKKMISYKIFRTDKIDSTSRRIDYPIGITFLNGNYSSKESFETESRVKKVIVKVNDTMIKNNQGEEYNNLSLDKAYFFNKKSVFECLVSPFKDNLMMYIFQSSDVTNIRPHKDYVHTIFIQIQKSTSESKEINISDLYLFGYQDWYGKNRSF
ncbi:hypothetical protein Fleli_1936 [Bernardetia litoralis DSM 6794]|uniref:DUF4424 domain-containing protein n=1 Tax=Bernardetia litoralis (strain ATCC 23117 / DSM 6794 / NBRC 15988 / NCIMB 1366 / Fx l1 / Sio-4) TaxID=880071 RepID=I4AK39_BERLS|nr:hypothetical protein [Bernardetia litoralis]AFM04324.1 hypothetical protein Fleli_1936 [Bernardetia litoralis DSM 6794]